MPLSGSAFWGVVQPYERVNLITNPSFERGTAGWGTLQAGTIGTASDVAAFGAWSGSYAPTSNGTCGVRSPSFVLGNGSTYAISAYIRGIAGIPYRIAVADSSGLNFQGSTTFTGGGTTHRYSFNFAEPSGATRTLVIQKNADSSTGVLYIDGVQVELGGLTTYIDGDQDGCIWMGAPHVSASYRSGTYRGGGSVVALADLGLKPDEMLGVGMPPQEVTSQSFALDAGGEYLRSRAGERPFTLTFKPITGTTLQDFHLTRKTIGNTFKPNLTDPQQPIRFWYTGGQGTVQIDAVYAGGLELGDMTGPMAESGAVRFIAHDPYWSATTQHGTALAARTNIGSANNIAARDPYGRWGTLGQSNGSTTNSLIRAVALGTDQTVYIGGAFSTVGGTLYPGGIGQYFPQTNTFGTFVGGTLDSNNIFALAVSPDNTLYIGGDQTTAGGTTSPAVSLWKNTFGTLTGGTIAGATATTRALLYSPTGTLYVGGDFNTAGGTTARFVARWANAVWGTLKGQAGGTVDTGVQAFAYDQRQTLYLGGSFTKAGGTTAACIASWNEAFGTLLTGVTNASSTQVIGMAVGPDQRLYVGGMFGSAGGGSVQHVAVWNGVGYGGLANGVGVTTTGAGVNTILPLADGRLLIAGLSWSGSASGRPVTDSMAIWNGYTYLPVDVTLYRTFAGGGIIYDAVQSPTGTLYIVGQFSGSTQAAAVAQIVNVGMAPAYPTLKTRNTGAGTARIFQFGNTLTGAMLYFDLVLQPSEEVILRTVPGERSFTSSFRGNIFGNILGGSNIAGFRLLPGTNYISFYADTDNLLTSIYWTPRSDSIDGGTIY